MRSIQSAAWLVMDVVTLIGACGPTIWFQLAAGAAPRPSRAPADVVVLDASPVCPSQTLGFYEGHPNLGSAAQTLAWLQQDAAARGADAIVILGTTSGGHHGGHDFTASAVTFLRPHCRW